MDLFRKATVRGLTHDKGRKAPSKEPARNSSAPEWETIDLDVQRETNDSLPRRTTGQGSQWTTTLYHPPPKAAAHAKPSLFKAPFSKIYHGILEAGSAKPDRILSNWHVRFRFEDRPTPPADLRVIRFRAAGQGHGFAYYEILLATLQQPTNKEWTFQARGPYYFPPLQYDTILKDDVYGYQAFFDGESASEEVEAFVLPSPAKIQRTLNDKGRALPAGLLAWSSAGSAKRAEDIHKCTPGSLNGRLLTGFYTREPGSTEPIRYIMKKPVQLRFRPAHTFFSVDLGNLAGASSQANLWRTGRMDDRFEMVNTWYRKPGCNSWVEVTQLYCRGV